MNRAAAWLPVPSMRRPFGMPEAPYVNISEARTARTLVGQNASVEPLAFPRRKRAGLPTVSQDSR